MDLADPSSTQPASFDKNETMLLSDTEGNPTISPETKKRMEENRPNCSAMLGRTLSASAIDCERKVSDPALNDEKPITQVDGF